MLSLLALFILTQAADGWTTYSVLKYGGFERPWTWIAWLMLRIGRYNTLLLVKGGTAAIGYYIYYIQQFEILAALTLAYAVQVYWNWQALQRQKSN